MQHMNARIREDTTAAVAHCRRCRARILWARTDRGRRMPLDIGASTEAGTVALDRGAGGFRASVIGHNRAAELRAAGHRLYVPHAATCTG